MGKKGDLLRAQKKESKIYTFTAAQLEEHDKFVLRQKREAIKKSLTEEMEARYKQKEDELQKMVEREWAEREKVFRNEDGDYDFLNILSLLLSVSASVLVKKFNWKPIPKDGYWDKRNKLAAFGDYLVDEINSICDDEHVDIRRYCDEVYEKYGVKFMAKADEEDKEKK